MSHVVNLVENLVSKDMRRFRSLVAEEPQIGLGDKEWAFTSMGGKTVHVLPPKCLNLQKSLSAFKDDVRVKIEKCCIAEYDVLTCDDDDVHEKMGAYFSTLEKLEDAMHRAITTASYDSFLNQIANKNELREISEDRSRLSRKRGETKKALLADDADERETAAQRYFKLTGDLTKLRKDFEIVGVSEIRELVTETPHFRVETQEELKRRVRNLDINEKVRTKLICMKKNKAEIQMALGPGLADLHASKSQLCDILTSSADLDDDFRVNTDFMEDAEKDVNVKVEDVKLEDVKLEDVKLEDVKVMDDDVKVVKVVIKKRASRKDEE